VCVNETRTYVPSNGSLQALMIIDQEVIKFNVSFLRCRKFPGGTASCGLQRRYIVWQMTRNISSSSFFAGTSPNAKFQK